MPVSATVVGIVRDWNDGWEASCESQHSESRRNLNRYISGRWVERTMAKERTTLYGELKRHCCETETSYNALN